MSCLPQLQDWFVEQCNGDWEHSYGVKLETLDNPGWLVDIDLYETKYDSKRFDAVMLERSEDDWLHCFVKDHKFQIRCGPRNLEEALGRFCDWLRQ